MKAKPPYASIDEYINSFPEDVRKKLAQLRKLILEVAPKAEERISYQMPAFFLNGILVWFAAHTNHIGFYPKASTIDRYKNQLSRYEHSKGTVQFPLDRALPADLIRRMVKYRVEENARKGKKKSA